MCSNTGGETHSFALVFRDGQPTFVLDWRVSPMTRVRIGSVGLSEEQSDVGPVNVFMSRVHCWSGSRNMGVGSGAPFGLLALGRSLVVVWSPVLVRILVVFWMSGSPLMTVLRRMLGRGCLSARRAGPGAWAHLLWAHQCGAGHRA